MKERRTAIENQTIMSLLHIFTFNIESIDTQLEIDICSEPILNAINQSSISQYYYYFLINFKVVVPRLPRCFFIILSYYFFKYFLFNEELWSFFTQLILFLKRHMLHYTFYMRNWTFPLRLIWDIFVYYVCFNLVRIFFYLIFFFFFLLWTFKQIALYQK